MKKFILFLILFSFPSDLLATSISDNFNSNTQANYGSILQGMTWATTYATGSGAAWAEKHFVYHSTSIGSQNHYVQAKIRLESTNVSGLILSSNGSSKQGYVVYTTPGNTTTMLLATFNSPTDPEAEPTLVGTWTYSGGKTWPSGTTHTMKCSVDGNDFHLYIDWNDDGDFSDADEDLGTKTSSTYRTSGYSYIGLYFNHYSAGSWLDDLVADELVVSNDAPTASDQGVSTAVNTEKIITLAGADVDSASLTFSVVTGPSHGSVGSITGTSCTPAGAGSTCTASITYTPTTSYTGSDSFTFRTYDTELYSSNATVSIYVGSLKQVILIGIDGIQYNHYDTMRLASQLPAFQSMVTGGGWTGTHTITGHSYTSTAPGNAELHSGLPASTTGIADNTCYQYLSNGTTIWERLKGYNASIKLGSVYGKETCYIPNYVMGNAIADVDWWYDKSTHTYTPNRDWISSGYSNSEDVATKALEFINLYKANDFYLVVYFGNPDSSGHTYGENSTGCTYCYDESLINCNSALQILLNGLVTYGISGNVKILVSADHGFNEGSTGHDVNNYDTVTLPLVTNNANMVATVPGSGRKQCDISATILNYFGMTSAQYSDITAAGCESLYQASIVIPKLIGISIVGGSIK